MEERKENEERGKGMQTERKRRIEREKGEKGKGGKFKIK